MRIKGVRVLPLLFFLACTAIICFNLHLLISQNFGSFSTTNYWKRFKGLEDMYNSSQYIQKHPKAIITDNVVYSYAAGRYIQGINLILVNPEVPPLGKYIIASSILIFRNENIVNLVFCIALFPLLFFLSYMVLKNYLLAIIPPVFFSFEKMFANQILVTPVLDIFQLDFLIISFIFFLLALTKKNSIWFFVFASLFLGCFISTKFFASGFVVAAVFIATTFLISRKKMIPLLLSLLVAPVVLILSYSRLFFFGYSVREVIGVQKWVFWYNTGHLGNPPFTVWDLILFNRMHTWWAGNAIIPDLQFNVFWPFIVIISLVTTFFLGRKSIKAKHPVTLIMVWCIFYLVFLNVGQISSRYFFILIPFLYILSVFGISKFVLFFRPRIHKRLSILLVIAILSCAVLSPLSVLAQTNQSLSPSSYVLPYPGVMPGNKLYVVSNLIDSLKGIFSVGDFASFKYNLAQSDKYLIEAKTLFEYNQYPLAVRALKKSNSYFKKIVPNLHSAKSSGKNISEKNAILEAARQKHAEVLNKLKTEVPETFVWVAEKAEPVNLSLWQEIDSAISLRAKQ